MTSKFVDWRSYICYQIIIPPYAYETVVCKLASSFIW